jgi:quercetin dioxygenase-like cupin family protein
MTAARVNVKPRTPLAPQPQPGPVSGYVIESDYEWAIDDRPGRTLKAGETIYEPTGCLHRVSRNPAAKGRTRVLAVVLHPHDAREIAILEKGTRKG